MRDAGANGGDLLQLRFHFGERDRCGDGPLEAAVVDACERQGVAAAVTLRGVEGFGAKQQLRTDRLLSLSEDAPLVVVAVGEAGRVEGLAEEVRTMAGDGLMVLESVEAWTTATAATTTTGSATTSAAGVPEPVVVDEGSVKATVWGPRRGGGSPHLDAVAALRRHGADAATVFLGVDGTLEGERRRARFFAGNRGVPAITVATGRRGAIESALADLPAAPPLVTLHSEAVERKSVIDRPRLHTRVSLTTSEAAAHGTRPRYLALIQALREEGAAGATALRGVWGFRGDREPHGDRVLALRRDVPIVVEAVDTAERAARWLELAEATAGADDLVVAETVDRVTVTKRL